jgi:uncharacterized protein YqcC (DUF446 family)
MESFGIFYGHLEFFTAIWYIFGQLVKLWLVWYIFPHFGILYQENSGIPAACVVGSYSQQLQKNGSEIKVMRVLCLFPEKI